MTQNALGENDTNAPMSESSSKRAPKNKTRPLSVAQQEKSPVNDNIGSRESYLGTPLQEMDTSAIGSDKSCVTCNVWRDMDHHHDDRHSDTHLDPTASQRLACVRPPFNVCSLADAHGEKEATGGNNRNNIGYQGSKTWNHNGVPQFTQPSKDLSRVAAGIKKLPVPLRSRSDRTAGTQLTVPNPQSSMHVSYRMLLPKKRTLWSSPEADTRWEGGVGPAGPVAPQEVPPLTHMGRCLNICTIVIPEDFFSNN